MSAINAVFKNSTREDKLVVGSIKSNIGHLESASALAGIIKTIECLERGTIPAQMHFENPSPKIDFTDVKVPVSITDWPQTRCESRRAVVNSFGAGGTNGHAVLEAWPKPNARVDLTTRPFLLKVSAASDEALQRMFHNYVRYVESRQPCLYDIAYTLLSRRSLLLKSKFLVASTIKELLMKLRVDESKTQIRNSEPVRGIVFIFTGQGAQW